jgi:hypothetical protein
MSEKLVTADVFGNAAPSVAVRRHCCPRLCAFNLLEF